MTNTNDETPAGGSTCYSSRVDYESMRRRFEIEWQRRMRGIEELWMIGKNDSTVHAFLEGWQHGTFESFEQMMCQLSVQLATEKAEYMKTAMKAIQYAPPPTVIVKDDNNEH